MCEAEVAAPALKGVVCALEFSYIDFVDGFYHQDPHDCLSMSIVLFLLQPKRARRSLCERMTPYSLPAGHDACQEGDECDSLWLLTEGDAQQLRTSNACVVVHLHLFGIRFDLLTW